MAALGLNMKLIFSLIFIMLLIPLAQADEAAANVLLNEEDIESYWVLDRRIRPIYPKKASRIGQVGCVNTAYVVGEDGKTHSHKILLTIPQGHERFQKSALKAIKKAKYRQSDSNNNREPVITSKSLTFILEGWKIEGMNEAESVTKLKDLCKIDLTRG